MILGLIPNSTEDQFGLMNGDVLKKNIDIEINSIEDVYFNGLLPALRQGVEIYLKIIRPSIGELKLCGKVTAKPREEIILQKLFMIAHHFIMPFKYDKYKTKIE